MITLMYVVGYLAYEYNYVGIEDVRKDCVQNISSLATTQCFFEAYVRKYVLNPLDMQNTGFVYLFMYSLALRISPNERSLVSLCSNME